MQPLVICQVDFSTYNIPFHRPFVFASNTIGERSGFYLKLKALNGIEATGEIAPLMGISTETPRRIRHDLTEIRSFLMDSQVPLDKDILINLLRREGRILNLCPSVRFGVESAVMMLAAKACDLSMAGFLGTSLEDVPCAALLEGNYDQVMWDVKMFIKQGYKVFKLKVGDRNIALDVKKVADIRALLPPQGRLRLDANRRWSLKEACLFSELVTGASIEFIEEPLSDISQLEQFYQQAHLPVALDETLSVMPCGVNAPGRCQPPLGHHEAVSAYVLKPMIIGGIIPTLDWIEQAHRLGKKAIISSCFESTLGLKVLANLACLTGQTAGLGTERWLKSDKPIIDEHGIIKKELLMI
ncbi:MAG: o-succinylbenzoate synthase [Candidatus Omnitrophica bacterium]|nr:o-succinylbenzoate synthase [Candidatus Omnitrophota bacterium]